MKTCLHSIRILSESDGAITSFTILSFVFQFDLKMFYSVSMKSNDALLFLYKTN